MTISLFSPFTLGDMQLDNRVVMAPMTRSMSPGNMPNDSVVEYYRLRAQGGTGLILTEGTCVGHKAASGYPNVPFFAGEKALDGWRKVVEAVHAEGGKIAPQLWHVGAARRPGVEPGGELPGYSPSGMFMPGKVVGHALSLDDIAEVQQAYVDAAVAAEHMGCDAIEIHGAHGYLIDQFFWSGTNQRDDHYGGSLENRLRFACEIIAAIRSQVSNEFPLILRFSQWKQQNYAARLCETPQELEQFLTPLSEAGVDIFHCSTRRFWEPEFDDSDFNLAGWTKKLTGKPTITVGSVSLSADFLPAAGETEFKSAGIASLDELLRRLDREEFDLVAIGRALIANPDWVSKVMAGKQNKLHDYDKDMLKSLI